MAEYSTRKEVGGSRHRIRTLLEELGVLPTIEPEQLPTDRGVRRLAAASVIVVTGFLLLIPNATPLVSGGKPPTGIVLSLLGTVLSAGLVGVGVLLYRSSFSTVNLLRVAIWNVLGVVVLGGIVIGIFRYQLELGNAVTAPAFTLGKILAIGATAHVVIGVYDARRVRAIVDASGGWLSIADRTDGGTAVTIGLDRA